MDPDIASDKPSGEATREEKDKLQQDLYAHAMESKCPKVSAALARRVHKFNAGAAADHLQQVEEIYKRTKFPAGSGGTQGAIVFHMQQAQEELRRMAGRQRVPCGPGPEGMWTQMVKPAYDAAVASGLTHHQALNQRGTHPPSHPSPY